MPPTSNVAPPRFSLACSVERRVSGSKPALDVAAPVRSARSSWCIAVSVSAPNAWLHLPIADGFAPQ